MHSCLHLLPCMTGELAIGMPHMCMDNTKAGAAPCPPPTHLSGSAKQGSSLPQVLNLIDTGASIFSRLQVWHTFDHHLLCMDVPHCAHPHVSCR